MLPRNNINTIDLTALVSLMTKSLHWEDGYLCFILKTNKLRIRAWKEKRAIVNSSTTWTWRHSCPHCVSAPPTMARMLENLECHASPADLLQFSRIQPVPSSLCHAAPLSWGYTSDHSIHYRGGRCEMVLLGPISSLWRPMESCTKGIESMLRVYPSILSPHWTTNA